MAVKSKEDILSAIRERFAEDNSDEVITFIEDVSDTFTDLEDKAKGDGKDWKAEAERIDKEWREKYKARFFSGTKEDAEDEPEESYDEPPKSYNYDDLFKKE